MTPDFWEWQKIKAGVKARWLVAIRSRLNKGPATSRELALLVGIKPGVEHLRFKRCLYESPDIRKIGIVMGPTGHPNIMWEKIKLMGTHRTQRYLTQAESDAIVALYLEDERTYTSIGKEFGRNHRSVGRLLARLGYPQRTGAWRPKSYVAPAPKPKAKRVRKAKPAGAKKARPFILPGAVRPSANDDSPLERAKNVLRRKGYVVYEPYRFDTSAVRGIVHVDHLRLTVEQVIERAGA